MTNFMFMIIVVIVLAVIILFGTVFGKQLRVKMKGRTDEVRNRKRSRQAGREVCKRKWFPCCILPGRLGTVWQSGWIYKKQRDGSKRRCFGSVLGRGK